MAGPTADGAFRVFLTVGVKPGMEDEFERAWQEGSDAVTAHPANLAHELARSEQERSVYFVISDWKDRESFLAFESSPDHVRHREKLHPFRESGSLALMRVVGGSR